MIERTVTVKSAETKDTKDGKRQFLSAVLMDNNGKENTQSIFDPAIQKTVQDAYLAGAPLLIRMEKEGQFWNIKSAEIDATPQAPRETTTPYVPDNKALDILLAVAYKGATECEGYWYIPDGKAHNDRVLQNTAELLAGLLLLRPKREEK